MWILFHEYLRKPITFISIIAATAKQLISIDKVGTTGTALIRVSDESLLTDC